MSLMSVLPPSPPRSSSRKERLPTFPIPPTSTPDDSPASGPPSSLGSRKKVNFSPWTNVLQPTGSIDIVQDKEIRTLPPSRECSASGKSILKINVQEDQTIGGQDGSSDEPQSVSEAMESIVHQLVRNDPMECTDAYQTLAAAVKAYEDLPDQAALRNQLHVITKSMKQHLAIVDGPFQPSDINLVTSALKVLVIFVWNSNFSTHLDHEFRIFALDRAISTIAENRAPKSVIVHYLHFLATQNFKHTLITPHKAARLIDGLSALTERFGGNGVVAERLLVYSRLLEQATNVMKAKAAIWTEHMLSAMVSTVADTRGKALALGRKACHHFSQSLPIATALRSVLDSPYDDKQTKGAYVCKKLQKLVESPGEHAEPVPQMWAVVILLCSSPNNVVASWAGFTHWKQLIQCCFNVGDSNLRIQANFAWNRFIYAARPHELCEEPTLTLLANPLVAQLTRKAPSKTGKATFAAATSSYCMLLYYAMRPAVTTERLNKLWDEYIVKVMRSAFFRNSSNADLACRILASLFWNGKGTQKIWNENRAHENHLMEPEELPILDGKWVRSRAKSITKMFAVLFKHCSWGRADSIEQAHVSKAWRSFIKSIRSASSKEIKMTSESRSSAKAILQFVEQLSADMLKENENGDGLSEELAKTALLAVSRIALSELQVGVVLEVLDEYPDLVSVSILEALLVELQRSSHASSDGISLKQHNEVVLRFLHLLNVTLIGMNAGESGGNLLCDALLLLKPELLEAGLVKIEGSLKSYIKDDVHQLPSVTIRRLADTLSRSLSQINPSKLETVDAVFATAFSSTHKKIVSSIAMAWNEVFGECEALQIGPILAEALQRLRPYVELRMPPGCMDSWSEERNTVPTYTTQEQASALELVENVQVEMEAQDQHIAGLVPELGKATRSSIVEGVKSRARLRHEDSQVEFVPVQSSSPVAEAESQYLTDHQREVRDRQRSAPAVTFADLRSSPRPASRATSESRDCGLARKAAQMAQRPSTPPLPDHGDELEVQPSPTPKTRYLRNLADVEIPSSPPSIQENQDRSSVPGHDADTPISVVQIAAEADTTAGAHEESNAWDYVPDVTAIIQDLQNDNNPVEMVTAPIEVREANEADWEKDNDSILPEAREEFAIDGPTELDMPVPASASEHQRSSHVQKEDLGFEEGDDASVAETRPSQAASSPHDGEPEANIDGLTEMPIVNERRSSPEILPRRTRAGNRPVHVTEDDMRDQPIEVDAPSTPPAASSRIDSDELAEMSASQLSNDLDWSVVLNGLDSSPAGMVRAIGASNDAAAIFSSSQASQGRASSRKRKTASKGWTRSKKRKQEGADLESQESFVKIDVEIEEKVQEDVEDVIEVLVAEPDPPQIDDDGDMFVDAPESQDTVEKKRGKSATRGRRRKTSTPPVTRSERSAARRGRRSVYSQDPEEVPIIRHSSNKRASRTTTLQQNTAEEDPMQIENESLQQLQPDNEISLPAIVENAPSQQLQPNIEISLPEVVARAIPAPQPTNILESLQQTLDAVKNAAPGSLDLRAIDEMCFQIRFQAQLRGTV